MKWVMQLTLTNHHPCQRTAKQPDRCHSQRNWFSTR